MKIAYLGPAGTFSDEALLAQDDLASADRIALPTLAETVAELVAGRVDRAFVPFENSLEGSINAVLDALVFGPELRILREVVWDVHMQLLALPGTSLADVDTVVSIPVAAAQCRTFLASSLPGAQLREANATADAAAMLAEQRPAGTAVIAPAICARMYGLDILARDIEDQAGNQTRFVLVGRDGIPAPTGADRTTIVCFQRDDHPGSLYDILGQFAAREINLTRLESRPTKKGLGDYCFVIELDGHVADDPVADALRTLRARIAGVRFLGSYPRAGGGDVALDARAQAAHAAADQWLAGLRGEIG